MGIGQPEGALRAERGLAADIDSAISRIQSQCSIVVGKSDSLRDYLLGSNITATTAEPADQPENPGWLNRVLRDLVAIERALQYTNENLEVVLYQID